MALLDFFHMKYPSTDFHELNLDWCISAILQLQKYIEEFTAGNKLIFADPLQHDLTKTYAKNTIVLDHDGNAYLSLDTVPKGVQLSNADYWLMVFNFEDYTEKANKNFTDNYFRDTDRSPVTLLADTWIVLDDVLYKVTQTIAADGLFIIDTNIVHFTIEQFLKDFVTSVNTTLSNWYNQMTGTINQYKNDIDASELAYRNQLAQDIADTTASLQAQLNLAISGATVDSEVINARLGADGVTYPTLGDAIRTQFTNMGDVIDKIRNDTYESIQLGFTTGGFINLGVGVGNTVSFVPTSNASYAYLIYPCEKNDRFIVTAKGGSSSRAWGFVDTNLELLSVAADSVTVTDLEMIAPDDGYIVLNAYIFLDYDAYVRVWRGTVTLTDDITNFTDGSYINLGVSIGATVDLTPVANASYSYMIIDCHAGDRFIVTAKGGSASRAWGFIDSNNELLSVAGDSVTVTDLELHAVEDGKLIINGYIFLDRDVKQTQLVSVTDVIDTIINTFNSKPWNDRPWEMIIPSKLRVCEGIEMNLYYENIARYFSSKDMQITNFDNVTVKYYKDFSRYTGVNGQSDFSTRMQLYYNDTKTPFMTSDQMTVHTVSASAGGGQTKKVLVIGDSLTDADATTGELVNMFADDVMNIELIGTLGTAPNLNEGRAGWRAYTYAKCATGADDHAGLSYTNPFYNSLTQQFDFAYYMSANNFSNVDYVFICLGTNDLGSDHSTDSDIISYYNIMINSIQSYGPNIKIGLWLPPTRALYANTNRRAIDTALRMNKLLIDTYSASEGNNIYLVPVYMNVDPEHDYVGVEVPISERNQNFDMMITNDTVHVSVIGYKKIADVLFSYIKFFAE